MSETNVIEAETRFGKTRAQLDCENNALKQQIENLSTHFRQSAGMLDRVEAIMHAIGRVVYESVPECANIPADEYQEHPWRWLEHGIMMMQSKLIYYRTLAESQEKLLQTADPGYRTVGQQDPTTPPGRIWEEERASLPDPFPTLTSEDAGGAVQGATTALDQELGEIMATGEGARNASEADLARQNAIAQLKQETADQIHALDSEDAPASRRTPAHFLLHLPMELFSGATSDDDAVEKAAKAMPRYWDGLPADFHVESLSHSHGSKEVKVEISTEKYPDAQPRPQNLPETADTKD